MASQAPALTLDGVGAWEAIPNNPGSGGFYGKHSFKELNCKEQDEDGDGK
jgi:hypothetical protein